MIVYVNGRYAPYHQAFVHVEDRGYQFADGVYEVCEVFQAKLVDERRHTARLWRSLAELKIAPPVTESALKVILREVVLRNRVSSGLVYLQVTRGVAKRDHTFPVKPVRPALVVYARQTNRSAADKMAEKGVKAITVKENRWERVDIKSVSLLPNVLARQEAKEKGAREAIFVDEQGFVTEGAATSIWIVTKEGVLKTRPNGTGILPGITKEVVFEIAKRHDLKAVEEAFTEEELFHAREVFMSAATTLIMPIVEVNDRIIGNGAPGSVASALRQHFHSIAELS